MARSAFALLGVVACLAVLLATVPGRAAYTPNGATSDWLDDWIKAIPNLRTIWLNPVICSRAGIQCNEATQTISIRLDGVTSYGFNFIGSLPEAPSRASELQVTSISVRGKDRFSGTVPASWSTIKSLTGLDFSQTKLSGSIPDSLGSLNRLVVADFSDSFFCYGMPNWNRTGMPSLTQVSFKNNNMRGTFASSWSTFSAALSLDLKGNKLCGCMPSSWQTPNLISAANAMDSSSVNGCSRVCTEDSLSYCPKPRAKAHSSAPQAATRSATLSATLVALAVAIASFAY